MAFDFNSIDTNIPLLSDDDIRECFIMTTQTTGDCFANPQIKIDGTETMRRQGCFKSAPKYFLKDYMVYLKDAPEAANFADLYLENYKTGDEKLQHKIPWMNEKKDVPWLVFGQVYCTIDPTTYTITEGGNQIMYVFLGVYHGEEIEANTFKLNHIGDSFWFDSSKKR